MQAVCRVTVARSRSVGRAWGGRMVRNKAEAGSCRVPVGKSDGWSGHEAFHILFHFFQHLRYGRYLRAFFCPFAAADTLEGEGDGAGDHAAVEKEIVPSCLLVLEGLLGVAGIEAAAGNTHSGGAGHAVPATGAVDLHNQPELIGSLFTRERSWSVRPFQGYGC